MAFYVLCPLFMYEKKTQIGCESGTIKFPSYKHKARLMRNLCCRWDYEKCERFKMTVKKYGWE